MHSYSDMCSLDTPRGCYVHLGSMQGPYEDCQKLIVWQQETFRSFFPTARTSSTVLEVEFHPDMSPRPGPLEQGALDSPKKLEELDKQEEVTPPQFELQITH